MPHTVLNVSRQTPLATHARLAADPFSRLIGWLGRRTIGSGEGLILQPCSSIHMFGMRVTIDALYVDGSGIVVHAVRQLRPWHIGPIDPRAAYVVELPAGTIEATGTTTGDIVALDVGV